MQAKTPALERQLTELDFARLRKLSASQPQSGLAELLQDADVVRGPDVDPAVVTMYTRFELEEDGVEGRRTLAICYPEDAEPASGFISVLSPLGIGLIGLREGDEVQLQTPQGQRRARIAAVLFQPEATGDYVT